MAPSDPVFETSASRGGSAPVSGPPLETAGSSSDQPTRATDASPPPPPRDLKDVQALLPGYELISEIHRGGQGVVYRARQLGTKRLVALKVLLEGPFAGETARRRFEREVELAASLRHPNIVTILDSGISHGRYYFAMELIEGVRLDQYLRSRRPPLPEVVELLTEICEAVNFAHQRGVLHRDLKPGNILIEEVEDRETESGGSPPAASGREGRGPPPASGARRRRPRPKILDFGLAKTAGTADPHQTTIEVLSTTGQVIGTLAYMSPEQASGSQDVDVRADVYSLGVIFYEALLGRPPYDVAGPLGEVLQRIVHEDPVRPRSLRSASRFGRQIDDELETILLRALEKDPARRYQSAGDLARDLRHYLAGEPIEAKRASGLYMLRKLLRRYRVHATAAALLLALLVTFLAVFAMLYTRERDARQKVEQLRMLAEQKTRAAQAAEQAERDARREAERASRQALIAAEDLRRALIRQKVQRGNLALAQEDLAEARDSFWDAFDEPTTDPTALWGLRQYYLQTGDEATWLAFYLRAGPVALSPDGRLIAVCETPRSITVREAETGRPVAWVATPHDVLVLSVGDGGELAAAGWYWARAWQPGSAVPALTVELDEIRQPLGVFAWSAPRAAPGDGAAALQLALVDTRAVRCFGPTGEPQFAQALAAAPVAAPAAQSGRPAIAVPTQAGLELTSLGQDGAWRQELFWSAAGRAPVRAVDLARSGVLTVLSDGIDVAETTGERRGQWSRVANLEQDWDSVHRRESDGAILLATREGRVALLRDGRTADAWRVTRGRLEAAQFAADGTGVLTLDERGGLTRWRRGAGEQRRVIHDRPAVAWAVSADLSTVMFADPDGQVITYARDRLPGELSRIHVRGLGGIIGRSTASDYALALSDDGRTRAIASDGRIWLQREGALGPRVVPWVSPETPVVKDLALSGDGRVLAVFSQSQAGENQLIHFLKTDVRRGGPDRPAAAAAPVVFVGSLIRDIEFLAGTNRLLVARASGALVLLEPQPIAEADRPRGGLPAPVEPPPPWLLLEAGPTALAVDRDGRRLAVACDDGSVRIIGVLDTSELGRINIGHHAASLGFSASGQTLLVRTTDGSLSLYDLASFERIAHWSYGTGQERMAAWIGPRDALLIGHDGRVWEHEYRAADQRIEQHRIYGRQRRVARELAEADLLAAWEAAAALDEIEPQRSDSAREAILAAALRRVGTHVPAEWIEHALRDDRPLLHLRIGHAAYDGARFELARTCLDRAQQGLGALDAYSAWRRAECEYVLGDPLAAAEALARVVEQRDFCSRDAARLQLERLAGLYLGDRRSESESLLDRLDEVCRARGRSSTIDLIAAVVIGNYLLGRQEESQLAASFQAFLRVFEESWLNYRDDIEFFAGEAARKRGDLDAARERYRRCIDMARDAWPAGFARQRLAQLSE